MSQSYPKAYRLRSRSDFKRMGWRSARHSGSFVVIEVRKNNSELTRLGITVTRKFGGSPQRNRFKRVVREAFRIAYPNLIKGVDLNVRPRHHHLKLTMHDVSAELMRFLAAEPLNENVAQ